MSLAPRSRIGPYEITGSLGAGGMGEVYRARDARLARDVALKVLPAAFARDKERMDRFSREAQVLASLNHPNIASLYGLEESGDVQALVMELVEGPTLAERIERGALPLDEAIPIARQMAEALEAAHEKGVIHRDLKPANVKVTPEGVVKVLDFGLAKAMDEVETAVDVNAPTVRHSPTRTGIIMGTAGYMSPEQARGKAVDRRADIWAFGVVLYEMLSGRPLYGGETAPETMAAVILTDPKLEALPSNVPEPLRRLLDRCLVKEPKMRLRDIGEARIQLDEALRNPQPNISATPAVAPSGMRFVWPALCGALLLVSVFLAARAFRSESSAPVSQFHMHAPEGTQYVSKFPPGAVISPDGRKVVFAAQKESEPEQLWLRLLESPEARPLAGTAGAAAPFWSPDSRWIGFFAEGKLKKMEWNAMLPMTLADASEGAGAAWLEGDQLVVDHSNASPLGVVSASGGAYRPVTSFQNPAGSTSHISPKPLPGGKHFLFFARSVDPKVQGVYVGSIDGGPAKLVANTLSTAEYSSAAGGHLLYVKDGMLVAQSFDLGSFGLKGEPRPLVEGVSNPGARGNFSLSESTLLHSDGGLVGEQMVTYDRNGQSQAEYGPPVVYGRGGGLSPDGGWVAIETREIGGKQQLRLFDLTRGISTLLADGMTMTSGRPVFSRDGALLAYMFGRKLVIRSPWNPSEKPSEFVLPKELNSDTVLADWTPSGSMIWTNGGDIWLVDPKGGAAPRHLTETPGFEGGPTLSPDSKWLAYTFREQVRDGRSLVLHEFDTASRSLAKRYLVGSQSLPGLSWKGDGSELYYLTEGGELRAVTVDAARQFPSRVLARLPDKGARLIGVTKDGSRFVAVRTARSRQSKLTLAVNWSGWLQGK